MSENLTPMEPQKTVIASENDTNQAEPAESVNAASERLVNAEKAMEQEVSEGAPKEPEAGNGAVKEQPQGSLSWKVAQAKRYRHQAEQRLKAVNEKLEELRAVEQRVSEHTRLGELLRSDPEAALEEIAKHSGVTVNQIYERLTKRRINDGEPGGGEALAEIHALRAEMRERDRKEAEKAQEASLAAQKQGRVSDIAKAMTALASVRDNPELSKRWPHLAAWSPSRMNQASVGALEYIYDNARETPLDDLADFLDGIAKEEYDSMHASLSRPLGADPATNGGKNGQGLRNPAQGGAKTRTVTNHAAAQSSVARRDLSHEERLAQADELLRALVSNEDV